MCFQKFQEGDLVIVRETFSYTDIYNHRRNVLDVNTILKIVNLGPKSVRGGMSVTLTDQPATLPLWITKEHFDKIKTYEVPFLNN